MQPEFRKQRILVIDDDHLMLELISMRLTLAGFQTYTARSGAVGVDRAMELQPAGMVLDVDMPQMNGFQVLERLQACSLHGVPPTLVLTARNQPDDIRKAISLGARDFLAKPFQDDQLIARVRRLMKQPRPKAEKPAVHLDC